MGSVVHPKRLGTLLREGCLSNPGQQSSFSRLRKRWKVLEIHTGRPNYGVMLVRAAGHQTRANERYFPSHCSVSHIQRGRKLLKQLWQEMRNRTKEGAGEGGGGGGEGGEEEKKEREGEEGREERKA